MKTIKFKAFIENLKLVVPVERINFDCETVEVDLSQGSADFHEYNFNEVELMQYIDLKDRNGEEIYEGYILEFNIELIGLDGKTSWTKGKGFVLYNPLRYAYVLYVFGNEYLLTEVILSDIEVIGNIYDKPELLEAK